MTEDGKKQPDATAEGSRAGGAPAPAPDAKEDSLQVVATAMLTGYNLGKQAAQTA